MNDLDFLRFKDSRCKFEFWLASKTHPNLVGLVVSLGNWIWFKFKKPIIVTNMWRTEDEQKQLYNTDNPPDTAHYANPLGRAADIRAHSNYFTKEEEKEITEWINTYWKRTDGYPTIRWHGNGDNYHLHIQVGH